MGCIQKGSLLMAGLWIYSASLYAQLESNYEIGVNINAFVYQGDLTPSPAGSPKTMKPGASVWVNRFLNNWFSLRGNIALGTLHGDDAAYAEPAWRRKRNLSFTSPVMEFSVLGVWSILGKNGGRNNHGLAPYLVAGAGYAWLHINRDWSRFNTTYFSAESRTLNGLAADTVHRLPSGIPVIPVGAGLRYALSRHFSVNAEFSYRFTTTDYLDGFSQVANPQKKDYYYTFSGGLIYSWGEKDRMACPVIKY